MGKRSNRIISNEFLRKAGIFFLLLMALDIVVELSYYMFFYSNSADDPLLVETEMQIMFRGAHYFGSIFHFQEFGIVKFVFVVASFFTLTAWVYRGMRNLRGMGLHSHLEPNWILASWIIAPLLILTFPMSVRDIIDKNSRIYDLLGRKPGAKVPKKEKYHRMFTHWWYSFWLAHLILLFGIHNFISNLMYGLTQSELVTKWAYLIMTLALALFPLFLGIRFLRRFGVVEDAVLEIGDSGTLEFWRDEKLQSGQIKSDISGLPDWYTEEDQLNLEMPEEHIFRDQANKETTKFGPA